MVKPDPTSPASDILYSLREAGSRIRRFHEKIMVRHKASGMTISASREPVLNYGQLSRVRVNRPIGGEIKLIHLRKSFPECFDHFNLVYLVSSALPPQVEGLNLDRTDALWTVLTQLRAAARL